MNGFRSSKSGVVTSSIPAAHPLDLAVAWLSRRSKLFSHGWGDEALFARLSDRVSYFDPPSRIALHWSTGRELGGITRRDGTFLSPLELLPEHTRTVHVRAWTRAEHTAACVILAGSRDEGFRAREHIFGGLIARGLDLHFLENPFYGSRRTPPGPSRMTISDHGLMVLGMVLEARALLEHLRPRYRKLVVAGYSMGGHMADITAAVTPLAVGCAALATGASASSIYTRGLLSWSVDLDALGGAPDLHATARERLHQLFEVADVTRYPLPVRSDAAVIVGCKRDGYVFNSETERLHRHWKGSALRWIPAGHFSALVTSRRALCDCVAEAADKL
jgi:pimeloyl-ACP methyl ester carboxylesterase